MKRFLFLFFTSAALALAQATIPWVDVASPAAVSSIGTLTPAGNTMPYYTGASTAALADVSAFALTLLDDATAANVRTTLGLGTGDSPMFAAVTASGSLFAGGTDSTINSTSLAAEAGLWLKAGGSFTASTVNLRSDGAFTILNAPAGYLGFRQANADVGRINSGRWNLGGSTDDGVNTLKVTGRAAITGQVNIVGGDLGGNSLNVYTGNAGKIGVFQTNGAVDGNTLIDIPIGGPGVTGSIDAVSATGPISGMLKYRIYNNHATGSAAYSAMIAAGTGDALTHYQVNGGTQWVTGLDQSDASKFKISNSGGLGASDAMVFTGTTGAAITGNVSINGTGTSTVAGVLRIGSATAGDLGVRKDQNSATGITLSNQNSGTTALAGYAVDNGAYTTAMEMPGQSFTTSGPRVQNRGYVFSDGSGGLALHAVNGLLRFWTGNPGAEHGYINSAGNAFLNNALQVAGSIASTVNSSDLPAPSSAHKVGVASDYVQKNILLAGSSGGRSAALRAAQSGGEIVQWTMGYLTPDGSTYVPGLTVVTTSTGVATVTIGSTSGVKGIRTATATLDFGSISGGSAADLTITVTGAAVGDQVIVGPSDGGFLNTGIHAVGVVTATNTVTVRAYNYTGSPIDPASQAYRTTVISY